MALAPRPSILAAAMLAAAVLSLASADARAQVVTNGSFTLPGTSGQLTVNTTLNGWTGMGKEGVFGSTTTPPVFVYQTPGSLTTGVNGDAFMGTVKFYGATAPPAGTLPVVAAAGDSDWGGGIKQTLSGLSVGSLYTLTFNWAGAQQQGYSGATTEKWPVILGSTTLSTATVSTPSQSFVGWQTASMSFTPTSASQRLTFLAVGAPGGQPPWLLLNNV